MKQLLITDYISLKSEMDQIPTDIDQNILLLSLKEFMNLLVRFRAGEISEIDLERIADLIESKDGVLYENDHIKESIHAISNIDISGLSMDELVGNISSSFFLDH